MSVVLSSSKEVIYHVQPTQVTNQCCRYCYKSSRHLQNFKFSLTPSRKGLSSSSISEWDCSSFFEVPACPGIVHIHILSITEFLLLISEVWSEQWDFTAIMLASIASKLCKLYLHTYVVYIYLYTYILSYPSKLV